MRERSPVGHESAKIASSAGLERPLKVPQSVQPTQMAMYSLRSLLDHSSAKLVTAMATTATAADARRIRSRRQRSASTPAGSAAAALNAPWMPSHRPTLAFEPPVSTNRYMASTCHPHTPLLAPLSAEKTSDSRTLWFIGFLPPLMVGP